MITEGAVRRFGVAVSCGKVYGPYGPYASQLGTTPYFVWVAYYEDDVREVITLLRPFVSPWVAERFDALLAAEPPVPKKRSHSGAP